MARIVNKANGRPSGAAQERDDMTAAIEFAEIRASPSYLAGRLERSVEWKQQRFELSMMLYRVRDAVRRLRDQLE